ncbi:solute carrier family 25 member 44 [Artemisia annua]|uniref:Solute carrier family 25 member 44 n=1 Tax=Artemisia annua TaxID=35608 RepID=A0A2U1M919_ARTAN|nr:solute carrier family 25 member 44 [Artemisia annua]
MESTWLTFRHSNQTPTTLVSLANLIPNTKANHYRHTHPCIKSSTSFHAHGFQYFIAMEAIDSVAATVNSQSSKANHDATMPAIGMPHQPMQAVSGSATQDDIADIDWEMLDKSKFFFLGAALFSGTLYPTVVLKTWQHVVVKDTPCFKMAVSILRHDGFKGFYRGFGTSLMGTIPDIGWVWDIINGYDS